MLKFTPRGKIKIRKEEGALEAANAVLRRIIQNREYLNRNDEKSAL